MKKIGLMLLVSVFLLTGVVQAEGRFNMSYLYGGSNDSYLESIENTNELLDVVSPNYFNLTEDGDLALENIDPNFVNEIHDQNLKIVPFLSNHWDFTQGENALKNREKLSTDIAKAIETYNLDGINIDIEGLNETVREMMTDFVRLLRSKLPADKEIAVAVASNPNGSTVGWAGQYDYEKLANYADYLMIMTYDQSYRGSNPGPVASISFVEKSIEAAFNFNVPANKIVLGLPFYGRIWKLEDLDDEVKPKSDKIIGDGVSLTKANKLFETFDVTISYSDEYETPKATFEIKEGDPEFQLASWKDPLEPGKYELWFENEQSYNEKLKLVDKYNLKGTGSWSLGQEDPSFWTYYADWHQSNETNDNPQKETVYFSDVQADFWALADIIFVKEKGWMNGKSSSIFAPNDHLTRAQAAAILVRALDLQPTKEVSQTFNDVSTEHWAYTDIAIIAQHNIFKGSNGNFNPNDDITREQFATVLYRILGNGDVSEVPQNPFSDVDSSRWSHDAIAIMKERDIFQGREDGSFDPLGKTTRAHTAALLHRIANLIEK
ncbi:glycosyl hydrolase family 18 protein [Cytobacillus sp. Hm23]